VTVGEVAETKTPPKQQIPEMNKIKKPGKEVEEVVVATDFPSPSGLIYGPSYDAAKDCANCGMAGNKKSCDSCGSGLNK
jgi:hypothetical protein